MSEPTRCTVLTTQAAADMLNVSRQYVLVLIAKGELPASRTRGGSHCIEMPDLLRYKERRDLAREEAFNRLVNAGGEDDE